jgi:hypothetical protein
MDNKKMAENIRHLGYPICICLGGLGLASSFFGIAIFKTPFS